MTAFVQAHLPEVCKIVQDDYNGRWYIVYPERAPKSVSWTKRGYGDAASRAIWTGWAFHTETTGEVPPWRTTDLDKIIQDEVANI